MEDALVLAIPLYQKSTRWRLNPCFNGRCTRTEDKVAIEAILAGLNPCFNGRCTRTNIIIFVLTEINCLNPCFNGRCTRTTLIL